MDALLHPVHCRNCIRPDRNHFPPRCRQGPKGSLVPGASITLAIRPPAFLSRCHRFRRHTTSSRCHTRTLSHHRRFQGIRPSRPRHRRVLVNQPATLDFTLSIQATCHRRRKLRRETLNFTDAMGNSVGNTTIEALPWKAATRPRSSAFSPACSTSEPNLDSRQGAVAGGRSDQGNITLDGLDDNDQIGGTAFDGILRSTLDSTEEFRVTTSNGTADAGRCSGAQVDLVTKAGTNKEHGSLYEYYRPTNTVANYFFLKNEQLSQGEPTFLRSMCRTSSAAASADPSLKTSSSTFSTTKACAAPLTRLFPPPCRPRPSWPANSLPGTAAHGNVDTLPGGHSRHALREPDLPGPSGLPERPRRQRRPPQVPLHRAHRHRHRSRRRRLQQRLVFLYLTGSRPRSTPASSRSTTT